MSFILRIFASEYSKLKIFMRKIKFDKVKCLNVDGEEFEADMTKHIANALYNATASVDMLEVARAINKGEEIELTDEVEESIIQILPQSNMVAFAQLAVQNLINETKKEKDEHGE